MRKIALLMMIGLLAGCGKEPSDEARLSNRAARIEKANAQVSKPVVPRVQQVGKNELLTVEIPSADHLGYIDTQRCYVWRDTEMRTAALSCPHQPESAPPK